MVRVIGYRTRIGLEPDNEDGTTPTTVEATVASVGPGDPITGTDLWKLDVLGSDEPDGTGELLPIAEDVLPPEEANKPLTPGDRLPLAVTTE